ncbi:MAG: hypothetical protein ACJKTH_03825 [Patescibacteria group bacterium UBA2163]
MNKNKKGVLVGVGSVIMITGLVLLINLIVTPPRTVLLTENGFSPTEITVAVGETVTFVNRSNKYFWPASDFHPTHEAYPEFDTQQALPPGATWEFTFTESGLFKYHDHLAPFYFGIVRVTGVDGELTDSCISRGGNLACWQDDIFLALAEDGLGAAYDKVAELYESEPEFAQSCHYIAHNIGLASYGFYRKDSNSIMTPKASACASGFHHGFMEAYLGATDDIASAGGVCEAIGEAVGRDAPDARLQCYHGIGHGVMETFIANTGEFGSVSAVIDAALAQCEVASEGEEERFRCASGLFNGIANLYINNEYGLDVSKENPVTLCAAQEGQYAESCYGNMNSVIFWMADNQFLPAAQAVLSGTKEPHLNVALEYLAGLYAYNELPSFNSAEVVDVCRRLGTHQNRCIAGFAHGLLEHGIPEKEYEAALDFCADATLSVTHKDACYTEVLGDLDGWYSVEKTRRICNTLTPELAAYCPQDVI